MIAFGWAMAEALADGLATAQDAPVALSYRGATPARRRAARAGPPAS